MDKKLPIKLLVDTKTNKVLFAEAGKDVIDFLFGLLALPISSIIKLLSKEQMVGCIGDLYSSLEQLEDSYLLSNEKKLDLLNPPISSAPTSKNTLLLTQSPVANNKWYYCVYCPRGVITDVYGTLCPSCRDRMCIEVQYVGSKKKEEKGEGEGFVKGVVTYIIMDDLRVVPMSTISSITLLNKFQIKDLGSLQERTVQLGINEARSQKRAI